MSALLASLLAFFAGWSVLQWILWIETILLVVLLLNAGKRNAAQRFLIGHIDQLQQAVMVFDEALDWYAHGGNDGGYRARRVRLEVWGMAGQTEGGRYVA
jgi:hypothetical protein